MAVSTPCPDVAEYQALASGQLWPEQKEELLRHLETCNSCITKIQIQPVHDTLVEWILQATTACNTEDGKQLDPLMQRLIQLQKSNTGSSSAQVAMAAENQPGLETSELQLQTGESRTLTSTDVKNEKQVNPTDEDKEKWSFLAPAQASDEIGRLGPYRVLKVLGAGGMGVVFRAEDPDLQRLVALKAMLPALAVKDSARQRFLREARAAAALKHDHIVTIHQVGEDRGAPFLAMEFLQGESLDDRIKDKNGTPIKLPEILRIGREIAEGLEAAHEHGLIHRDIKPGNIWLEGKRGRVKILDFGLARGISDDVQLTQSGAIVGTPAYMPPEQARGEKVDGRCDLYSLGCVLYRLCTGQLPFKGENTMSLLMALATEQPRTVRELNADIPPALNDLIMQLLAKEPAERPGTAREVADRLSAIETGEPDRVETLPAPLPPRRRHRLAVAVVAGAVALAVLAAVIVIRLGKPEDGTVTIETVDPDVELVFTSGGKEFVVRDKKNGEEVTLPLGSYQVNLKGGKDGLKLETNQFTLKSGTRELVRVTRQPPEAPKEARADIPPPVEIAEPPPLAEWIKGRTVLTVAQDGSAKFKTIQAALNALKPHQVVKVLDKGPYLEILRLEVVPEDTGLIGEVNTVLELPKSWDTQIGHVFGLVDRFRLSGFRFLTPKRDRGGMITHWTGSPSGLVIEDCCFDPEQFLNPWPAVGSIQLGFDSPRSIKEPVVVRRCAIYGGAILPNGKNAKADILIENNYFHKTGDFYNIAKQLRTVIIRSNVFDYLGPHFLDHMENATILEVSNNTIFGGGTQFQDNVPTKGVTVRNNIMRFGFIFNKNAVDAAKAWIVGHNCYLEYGKVALTVAPKTSTDLEDQAEFLSLDPSHLNYLRVPADSPLGKQGTGGTWPNYIGALPPGPAPKEGDWFTRLRQRWSDGVPAAEKSPAPPVQIAEPPPLAEWLKGRTVLTVAKDGSGQFETIKAALDALKPHQVVKVLDRGPYRELLRAGPLPDDTGLISECQTVIEWPTELDDDALVDHHWYHRIGPLEDFRLSGLRLLAPPLSVKQRGILYCTRTSGLVLENCCLGWTRPIEWAAVGIYHFDDNEAIPKPIVVRNCLFDNASLSFAGETVGMPPLLIERNYFHNASLRADRPCSQPVLIRHNVFDLPRGEIWIQKLKEVRETFEISNNTSTGSNNVSFPSMNKDAPKRGMIVRNNISEIGMGFDGEAKVREDGFKTWQWGHNCYLRRGPWPKASTDVLADPQYLSLDPKHRDYLRVPQDSPLGKQGAGGTWPNYIGALPPGPAPKEGDWFTRLREKWQKEKLKLDK